MRGLVVEVLISLRPCRLRPWSQDPRLRAFCIRRPCGRKYVPVKAKNVCPTRPLPAFHTMVPWMNSFVGAPSVTQAPTIFFFMLMQRRIGRSFLLLRSGCVPCGRPVTPQMRGDNSSLAPRATGQDSLFPLAGDGSVCAIRPDSSTWTAVCASSRRTSSAWRPVSVFANTCLRAERTVCIDSS